MAGEPMTNNPWMPLYIGDFIRDTQHLDATQSGAYLHLIMHYWVHGGLPDDDIQLARIARMRVDTWRRWHRQTISTFFEPGWRHKRIDKELQRASTIREKRSRAGVIGAAARQANAKLLLKPGHTQSHKKITTTEYVPRESKKEASRGSKGDGEATDELRQTVERRGWKQ
jgi:uncharacterized protein YdaU (DUF1376 family)